MSYFMSIFHLAFHFLYKFGTKLLSTWNKHNKFVFSSFQADVPVSSSFVSYQKEPFCKLFMFLLYFLGIWYEGHLSGGRTRGLTLSKVINDQLHKACSSSKEDAFTNAIFRVTALLICDEGMIHLIDSFKTRTYKKSTKKVIGQFFVY